MRSKSRENKDKKIIGSFCIQFALNLLDLNAKYFSMKLTIFEAHQWILDHSLGHGMCRGDLRCLGLIKAEIFHVVYTRHWHFKGLRKEQKQTIHETVCRCKMN